MNVGSLFSGIGGIDLGLERAGMRVAWQAESDAYCRSILVQHWPDVPCYHDVRDINATAPRVDVLAGGFPCQPVSGAGKRLAQADERWLWPEFARIIRVLRPRYVVAENVPGLLARGLDIVLADLAALRFDAEWTVFGARDVGAPHKRDRVWIVAWDANPHGERLQRLDREGFKAWDSGGVRQDVANTDSKPLHLRNGRLASQKRATEGSEPQRQRVRIDALDGGSRSGGTAHWLSEPDVGRMAHGVPDQMAQLRALGNAVVPACAEHIGRLVMRMDA